MSVEGWGSVGMLTSFAGGVVASQKAYFKEGKFISNAEPFDFPWGYAEWSLGFAAVFSLCGILILLGSVSRHD